MSEKRNAIFTIAVIFSILCIFMVVDFIQDDRFYSETENRVLTEKPVLSLKEIYQGNFSKNYEDYVSDQFVGRDKWILVKTKSDILMQKKEINGVYLCKDNYLMEQHKPEDYTAQMEADRLLLLKDLAKRLDARVMLVPTADNILTDKLPENAPYYDETQLLAEVKDLVGEYSYIDVYSALKEHKEEEIYYRTDHHWTSLGAYYGYVAWAETVHRYPLVRVPEGLETVSEDFLGTLHSKINLPVQADSIQYFPDTEKRQVEITYDFGRTSDTFYEPEYLNTKNQYGFFLDDNHAFVEIHTGRHNGRSLFVIKDSYANCVIPMLAQHYENVYVVDLRYFNGRLYDFMGQYGEEGEMDVLVLYNCIHFLENFYYLK